MDLLPFVLIVAGLALLVVGAGLLVDGASGLAASFGVGPLLIALTVVAFGTSSPELATAVGSSLAGEPDLVVGNVVGSNIYNVLLILGLSALVAPLLVEAQLVRRDVPIMVAASVVVLAMAADGAIGRLDGLVLVGGLVGWTAWSVIQARRNGVGPPDRAAGATPTAVGPAGGMTRRGGRAGQVARVILGLVLLVAGAQGLVTGAVDVAGGLGIPELVVGLTIVAIGTSLPELATSVAASFRGERDIAVGNIVGSNVFNLCGVLGVTALVSADGVPVVVGALTFDIPVMIAVAIACLPVFFTGQRIVRWEGALFLACAAGYTAYLFLDATGHPVTDRFGAAMAGAVIPLTVITLLVATAREVRARRAAGPGRPAA